MRTPRRPGRRTAPVAALLLTTGALLAGCTQTSIPGLQVHTGPASGAPVVGAIPTSGTAVVVACWTRGEPVLGDDVWYRIRSPESGYVTNYYIQAAGDFANTEPC